MRDDPAGHYTTLGIDPDASDEAITAAFRAAARRVHPDVPGTGDAAAFMRVREAYDVLADPDRRAAYDRDSQHATDRETEIGAEPDSNAGANGDDDALMPEAAEVEIPAVPWPRPTGLSVGLWAGGAAVALAALAIGVGGLGRFRPPPTPARTVGPGPTSLAPMTPPPSAPAASQPAVPQPAAAPSPAPAGDAASGYILPAGGPATLWRHSPSDNRYLPAGQLGAFTPLATGHLPAEGGMVAVRTPDGHEGFVYADRLAPGDAATAERARCIYDAGAPPGNNEILTRRGSGTAAVQVQNLRDQPAVLKLRDATGQLAASVFIAPRGTVALDHLPPGEYRPEFAFGELWSHSCGRFMAGMRPQRFAGFDRLDETATAQTQYTLPPDDAVDETDDEFNRE